jgi:phage terminase large subunit-like protein
MSLVSCFLSLPRTEREKRVKSLSVPELAALKFAWKWWARPEQKLPADPWTTWMILAGRGFGKTRTGAETVRIWARSNRFVNLIGATADDARDIMIEGESGLLAICPNSERPDYKKSERKLLWPSGCISLIFTADEPERLRGKQHEKLWCDELGAWHYIDSWVQASLGLRLGKNPQAIVTTTPKPRKEIKELIADKNTHVTRGTTYDNRANLAPTFFTTIVNRYEGTRLGRQELNAEILDDIEGALWKYGNIENNRHKGTLPDLSRIVIGIDPAVSANKSSDETGIIAVGLGANKEYYPLADVSGIYTPLEWARKAIFQYENLKADAIVAEVNQGGDLVEANLRAAGFVGRIIKVHAAKGKATRAEPIAGLYEQNKVHHVGMLAMLESQMTTWAPGEDDSPDRVDALVWAMTEIMGGGSTFDDVRELGTVEDYDNRWR